MAADHVNINAFLCCDKIIIEAGNNKKTVVGIFRNFFFQQLPSVFGVPWFIFAQMSNLDAGPHTVTVNIAHDETVGVVFAAGAEIAPEFPGGDIDLVLPAQPAVFQKVGKHVVTLNIDGQQKAYYVLNVQLQASPIGG